MNFAARLYAHKYPGTIDGLLLVDSSIGKIKFIDLWPNPHAFDFQQADVVSDGYFGAIHQKLRQIRQDVQLGCRKPGKTRQAKC